MSVIIFYSLQYFLNYNWTGNNNRKIFFFKHKMSIAFE